VTRRRFLVDARPSRQPEATGWPLRGNSTRSTAQGERLNRADSGRSATSKGTAVDPIGAGPPVLGIESRHDLRLVKAPVPRHAPLGSSRREDLSTRRRSSTVCSLMTHFGATAAECRPPSYRQPSADSGRCATVIKPPIRPTAGIRRGEASDSSRLPDIAVRPPAQRSNRDSLQSFHGCRSAETRGRRAATRRRSGAAAPSTGATARLSWLFPSGRRSSAGCCP
jgi:hypothetical protein